VTALPCLDSLKLSPNRVTGEVDYRLKVLILICWSGKIAVTSCTGPLHLTVWFFWPKAKEYRKEKDHFVPGGGGGEVVFTDDSGGARSSTTGILFRLAVRGPPGPYS
jgi:hypothetical protein